MPTVSYQVGSSRMSTLFQPDTPLLHVLTQTAPQLSLACRL